MLGSQWQALGAAGQVAELSCYRVLPLENMMMFTFWLFAFLSFCYQGNQAVTAWSADPALLSLIT